MITVELRLKDYDDGRQSLNRAPIKSSKETEVEVVSGGDRDPLPCPLRTGVGPAPRRGQGSGRNDTMSTTPDVPWKVDFYEGETLLDTTLVGYPPIDVLWWARTRYAGIQAVRGAAVTVRLSSAGAVLEHHEVVAAFELRFPGLPWHQQEPPSLKPIQEIERDLPDRLA